MHATVVPLKLDEYDNDDDDDMDFRIERPCPTVNVAAITKLARNLDMHTAFIKALGKALHPPWPCEEKLADKRPTTPSLMTFTRNLSGFNLALSSMIASTMPVRVQSSTPETVRQVRHEGVMDSESE